jgi:hypothetical protein
MKGWHLAGLWVLGTFLAWVLVRLRASNFRDQSTDGGELQAVSVSSRLLLVLVVIVGGLVVATIRWFRKAAGPYPSGCPRSASRRTSLTARPERRTLLLCASSRERCHEV